MKRKYSEISKPTLTVYKPCTLPCDICSIPTANYELCTGNCVYCSLDCYEVIYLSKINDYLDIKRTKSCDDLMKLDK